MLSNTAKYVETALKLTANLSVDGQNDVVDDLTLVLVACMRSL